MNLSTKNLELAHEALEHLANHYKELAEELGAMGVDGRYTMFESTRAQKLADTIAKHLEGEEEKHLRSAEELAIDPR